MSVAKTEIRKNEKAKPVPAEYGQMLLAKAAEVGLTEDQLVRLAGYKDTKKKMHAYRLKTGRGAIKAAMNIRKVLVDHGAIVPPIPTDDGDAKELSWRDSWMVLGERLHDNMNDAEFARTVSELEKLANAHEIVRRGISATRHPLPRDADDDDREGD